MLSKELFLQSCMRGFTRQHPMERGKNGHWEHGGHGMHGAGSHTGFGVSEAETCPWVLEQGAKGSAARRNTA